MKFVIDNIQFTITDTGTESTMDKVFIGCSRAHPAYYAAKEALHGFLFAYHKAGGDVKSQAAFAGIRAILRLIDNMA